jgi:nucleotide-binding universal stress UspA family protein
VEFKADVIVKTTHGRSGLSRFLYGSVAARVLQQAPCPVLLIRVSK